MRASVIVFPGSNCDRDAKVALEKVTGHSVTMVWHQETTLPPSDVVVVPGGFSYGDYLRCGAIAVHSPIMREVATKARSGTPTIGICNGFQVLCEAGLLPGVLMRNRSLRYICRDVWLRVERNDTFFTSRYFKHDIVRIPVAHHDGNYFADPATLDQLEAENRVVFRYVTRDGKTDDMGNAPTTPSHPATSPANPNGSQNSIAGICDPTGRILGMMPHPERLFEPALGGTDGRPLFESIAEGLVH